MLADFLRMFQNFMGLRRVTLIRLQYPSGFLRNLLVSGKQICESLPGTPLENQYLGFCKWLKTKKQQEEAPVVSEKKKKKKEKAAEAEEEVIRSVAQLAAV